MVWVWPWLCRHTIQIFLLLTCDWPYSITQDRIWTSPREENNPTLSPESIDAYLRNYVTKATGSSTVRVSNAFFTTILHVPRSCAFLLSVWISVQTSPPSPAYCPSSCICVQTGLASFTSLHDLLQHVLPALHSVAHFFIRNLFLPSDSQYSPVAFHFKR